MADESFLGNFPQQVAAASRLGLMPSTRMMLVKTLAAFEIAQRLADVTHAEVGAEPRALADLIPAQRERFIVHGEIAVESLDPMYYEHAKELAVAETLQWGKDKALTTEDWLRECSSRLLANLSVTKGGRS